MKQTLERLRNNDPTLTSLNLWCTQIGPENIRCLAESLKQNKSLTTLYLWINNIGNLGARHFEESLKQNTTLITLNLDINGIEDDLLQKIQILVSTRHKRAETIRKEKVGKLTKLAKKK